MPPGRKNDYFAKPVEPRQLADVPEKWLIEPAGGEERSQVRQSLERVKLFLIEKSYSLASWV
jgi:hypothetical protein